MKIIPYSADETAAQLPYRALVNALKTVILDYAHGRVLAPERQIVPMPGGGVMLSMPCTASDLSIHKLVNVVQTNAAIGLPTINGIVAVYDSATGQLCALLDGPTVTARRTAALSMLGIETLMPEHTACHAVLIGTGTQAQAHALALADLFPNITLSIVGRTPHKVEQFVQEMRSLNIACQASTSIPEEADVVITLTTSKEPVYTLEGRTDRLVIGVGAFKPELAEIGARTLHSSQIYVDDLAGARHEAGDLIQAHCDWQTVYPLAHALEQGIDSSRPRIFKTVGCAAWDLAAARCAQNHQSIAKL